MAFPTSIQVKTALQSFKKLEALKPFWDTIVDLATENANQELRDFLYSIGYSSAVVEAWDAALVYGKRHALYWCGVFGLSNFSETERPILNKMNVIPHLKDLRAILVNGVLTPPDASGGQASGGRMAHGRELFPRPYAHPRYAPLARLDSYEPVGVADAWVNPLQGVFLNSHGMPIYNEEGRLLLAN